MSKSLNDMLQQQLDKNDPTQRAIGLLAALVDNKLEQMVSSIEDVNKKLEEQEKQIGAITHDKEWVDTVDTRLEKMEKTIEPLSFINDYPKLAVLMFLGLMALLSMGLSVGVDKLFNLIK